MKVAIFNRFWNTFGGGEKYSGGIAQVLAQDHEVHLLGFGQIDPPLLEEKLDLDLDGVEARIIEDRGKGTLAAAVAGYDLLINCSYLDTERNGARHGIYLVYFPARFDDYLENPQKLAVRRFGPYVRSHFARLEWGRGFYPPERYRLRTYRWTNDNAELLVHSCPGGQVPVSMELGVNRPLGAPHGGAIVEVDGKVVGRARTSQDPRGIPFDFTVTGHDDGTPSIIRIRSDTFVPSQVVGGGDERILGIQLRSIQLRRSNVARRLGTMFPILKTNPGDFSFLDTYDQIVSISNFAQEWVRRYWGKEGAVLYPPVSMQRAGEKEPAILSVGRFFDRKGEHNKKQLEMVRAFQGLVDRGLAGWEYHIVGGCEKGGEAYLREVQQEAGGLPVHFHINASGSLLRDLYAKTSIFWHATGLGESRLRSPSHFEHFGIVTVEAMSAGAVPIVFGEGGQLEIVVDGVSGFHFQKLGDLVEKTWTIVRDDQLRGRLSEGAAERARYFDMPRFSAELNAILRRIVN